MWFVETGSSQVLYHIGIHVRWRCKVKQSVVSRLSSFVNTIEFLTEMFEALFVVVSSAEVRDTLRECVPCVVHNFGSRLNNRFSQLVSEGIVVALTSSEAHDGHSVRQQILFCQVVESRHQFSMRQIPCCSENNQCQRLRHLLLIRILLAPDPFFFPNVFPDVLVNAWGDCCRHGEWLAFRCG